MSGMDRQALKASWVVAEAQSSFGNLRGNFVEKMKLEHAWIFFFFSFLNRLSGILLSTKMLIHIGCGKRMCGRNYKIWNQQQTPSGAVTHSVALPLKPSQF